MNINNEITLKYKIKKSDIKNNKVKLFGEPFVRKNKNNYKLIINDKAYELVTFLKIIDINEKDNSIEKENEKETLKIQMKLNDTLEVILKQIKNVTDISYMFSDTTLEKIDNISNWNTENICNMGGLFSECRHLTSLPDISNWDTSNIITMNNIFSKCYSLKELPDISKWNTSNVTDMSNIFNDCSSLSSLPDISKWNTSNATNINGMFSGCSSLSSLPDISKWNTINVYNMNNMFSGCSSLSSLHII